MTKGFTYIELLIVIAIIISVSVISVLAYTNALVKSRDTERKSDLKQYQIALQNYGIETLLPYPVSVASILASNFCNSTPWSTGTKYLQSCPQDGKNASDSSFGYFYTSNNTGQTYVLYAKLEDARGVKWVYCSNGKSGEVAVATAITAGICPLP